MSFVYMISDLHLGHKNIANFRKTVYRYRYGYSELVTVSSMEEHEELFDWLLKHRISDRARKDIP